MAHPLVKEMDSIIRALPAKGFGAVRLSRADSHCIVTWPQSDAAAPARAEEIFAGGLRARKMALYFHLPFCAGRCRYCHYSIVANPQAGLVEKYLRALGKEMELVSEIPGVREAEVVSAYVGGGTPTFLEPRQLRGLLGKIRELFNVRGEFIVESSPETLTGTVGHQRLAELLDAGVNRLSMGVQSFDDTVLSFAGRRHDRAGAVKAVEAAQAAGLGNMNIDLIMGLPRQGLEVFEKDVETAAGLGIPSITTYSLTLRPEAPFYGLYRQAPAGFPSDAECLAMHALAMDKLGGLGYREYPAWWFTKSDKAVYRGDVFKWRDNGEMIGMGVGTYSFANNWQYFNHHSVADYVKTVESGRLPVWKAARISDTRELAKRNLIMGIRCGIDKATFAKKYGPVLEEDFKGMLGELEESGLIADNGKEIALTKTGRLVAEKVSWFIAEKTSAE